MCISISLVPWMLCIDEVQTIEKVVEVPQVSIVETTVEVCMFVGACACHCVCVCACMCTRTYVLKEIDRLFKCPHNQGSIF